VDLTAVRVPPAKPLSIVVAGFTADEAASELLSYFLDYAPANGLVLLLDCAVKHLWTLDSGLRRMSCWNRMSSKDEES
jgi:hypothetical protein